MKSIILGSGPTKDYEMVKNFEGTKIICDKEWTTCYESGIHVDYVFNLEDCDLSHYFKYEVNGYPIVITSIRSNIYTREQIGKCGHMEKLFPHPLVNQIYNVGLMAWFYAVNELKSEEIYLTGFDHLYPDSGYDLEHHMWRQMFHELQALVPRDIKTVIPPEHRMNYSIQMKKDAIMYEQAKMVNPGFSELNDYIRYRRDMNEKFIRRLKHWEDDRI